MQGIIDRSASIEEQMAWKVANKAQIEQIKWLDRMTSPRRKPMLVEDYQN